MSVGNVEAELKKAMQLQVSTSAALTQAVQDKLKAEADLKTAMVSTAASCHTLTAASGPAAVVCAAKGPCCSCTDDLMCVCVCCVQAAQPLAAKLLSGAQNVSFQANATRNAARQAVVEAQHKLAAMKDQLAAAKDTRHAAKQLFKSLPGQWGKSQFRVSASHSRHVESLLALGRRACI